MTTNVPKGAGRAAHTAKTNKHAQRTPLPPKGATRGVSKKESAEAIAEVVEESKMLKARSRGRKVASKAPTSTAPAAEPVPASPAPRKRKAAATHSEGVSSLQSLLPSVGGKAKKAPRATSKPTKASPDPVTPESREKPGAAKEGAFLVPSGSKAQQLLGFALGVGWECELEPGVMGSEIVVAVRDPETVRVTFRDNKLDLAEMPTHEYAGRMVKLRNVSAAKKVMETSPEDASKAQPLSSPRRERKERDRDEDTGRVVVSRRLPWESDEEPTNEQVLEFVRGRKLVWRNGLTGTYDEAHVKPSPVGEQRFLTIVIAPNGKRVLNFTSVEGGFRSVYVENLVQIR